MAIFLVKISAQDVPCIFCMIFLPSFESHAPNLKDAPMKLHETINRVVVETVLMSGNGAGSCSKERSAWRRGSMN